MVEVKVLDPNGNRSFGVESEIIPLAKLYDEWTKLEEHDHILHYSPHQELYSFVKEASRALAWLFQDREFFLLVIGGESYLVGCFDEELKILADMLHRFNDLVSVFVGFCSHEKCPSDIADTTVADIRPLFNALMSYNLYTKQKWKKGLEKHLEDHRPDYKKSVKKGSSFTGGLREWNEECCSKLSHIKVEE